MKAKIEGAPSFAHIHVDLAPGESLVAESDAMTSMAADLDMEAKFNGGFFSGLLKKFLGGESLFVNVFTNTIEQAVVMSNGETLEGELWQPKTAVSTQSGQASDISLGMDDLATLNLKEITKDTMEKVEKLVILGALQRFDYNKTKAAKALGISRRALIYKVQHYGLEAGAER